ncbi:MAG: gamma-glutamyl-gamma-aminobutyrate hydrolase family protein [Clostridia bacterium]|nr:gamma-glutamyl-gamma-aminobutyrate hydrolase family protein [Clostridia bacterium]
MTDTLVLHMNPCYPDALLRAGGTPLLLPQTGDASAVARYAQLIDGLLLSGGDDIDPARYGEAQSWSCGDICPQRDEFELALCREVLRLGKPIFGICRGIQLLNVALGGTLYQDLKSEWPGSLAHQQHQKPEYTSHPVSIVSDTQLQHILETDMLAVNSHHHQAVKELAPELRVSALSPDGVIEAVEHMQLPFCLAVQWHPERLAWRPGQDAHTALFRAFVEACLR